MSQVYTINPNSSLTLDRDVAEIECHVGTVSVVDASEESVSLEEGGTFVPAPGFVSLNSLRGANVAVTYADEVEHAPAARGDSGGGEHGGLEARTEKELRKEAADKDIKGRSKMDKDQLIAAIRAAE